MAQDTDLPERDKLTPGDIKDLRKTRVGEQWERIDSIVIGIGAAKAGGNGWFDTWEDFAEADVFTWFNGRASAAPRSLVNQTTERLDWAQTIHQSLCEFISPPGNSAIESDPNDGFETPQIFSSILPNFMPMKLILAESDEMTNSPGAHFPSGFGTAYATLSGAAAPSVIPGSQGEPMLGQGWHWPEPLGLAAKANMRIEARLDNPMRKFFAGLPGPGSKQVPDGEGGVVELPNWYIIRWTMRGPRWLQLRGARSSA